MPTRNISLIPEKNALIKLDKLRLSIRQGVAALDRGDYTDVEDENLDAYLDDLAAPARR